MTSGTIDQRLRDGGELVWPHSRGYQQSPPGLGPAASDGLLGKLTK